MKKPEYIAAGYPAQFIGGPLHGIRVENGPGGARYPFDRLRRVDGPTWKKLAVPWATFDRCWYAFHRMQGERRAWLYVGRDTF